MASKNSVKMYVENSYYHIYNRGVEKRDIFTDPQDYAVFLSYLETYVSPKDVTNLNTILRSPNSLVRDKDKALKLLRMNNYYGNIMLVAYALLPNHFHLLIRQKENVLKSFMNSLGTRYGMYFNRKHRRVGILFQDIYKAVLVDTDEQLLALTRYIHLNPTVWMGVLPDRWQEVSYPCSLADYVGLRATNWVHPKDILSYFSTKNPELTYEKYIGIETDGSVLEGLTID